MSVETVEANIPWSNVAESEIEDLEEGASNKLLRSGAPKHICDDC